MRKSLLTSLFILILSSSALLAQGTRDSEYFPKNEFYIQYGTPSILELVTTIKAPKHLFTTDTRNHKFSGDGGIGYNFALNDGFSVGVFGGFSYSSANVCDISGNDDVVMYNSAVKSYLGMAAFHWTFYSEGSIELSSGAYAGVNYRNEIISDGNFKYDIPDSNKAFKLAYHLTACKLRFGEAVGGFVEVGFGFRGLVNVGLSVKL